MWGEPSDVGAAVKGSTFDVVLDNNGKTLDVVQYVSHILLLSCCAMFYKRMRTSHSRL